ncbi:hypothetical protein EDD85DRAFT_962418 [Armillaria nabsnona]|nr:hypothetical protein EDD85DRAFT_962418 [Armillaria nabsnona]
MSTNVSNTYGAVTIGALSASLGHPNNSLLQAVSLRLDKIENTHLRHMATRHTPYLLRLGVAMGNDCQQLWQARYYTLEYPGDHRNYGSSDVSSALLLLLSDIHAKRNWFLTCPILILAAFRLGENLYPYRRELLFYFRSYLLASACVTTSEMLRLKTYSAFKEDFRWVFTLGLALSSAVDILITGSLFGLLRTSRSDAENLKAVIDSLILYTFETGSLTCAATIIDMICWITMSSNLIFMGLHFVIGKLYANSLLVTLNTRRGLRRGGQSYSAGRTGSAIILDSRRPSDRIVADPELAKRAELQINVERSIHYSTDYNVKLAPRGVTSQQSMSTGSVR